MLALIVVELVVRGAGLSAVPLYDADAQIGYIPRPNQQGAFMFRNDWAFNGWSMGVAQPFQPAAGRHDVLLLGDSIVLGGNPFRQGEKLAARLAQLTGRAVWPVAAGSWALRNELSYLRLHPEVPRRVETVVLVLNSADFDQASSWACEQTHPRQSPIWATGYVLRRYLWDPWPCQGQVPAELRVPQGDWRLDLKALLDQGVVHPQKLRIVLYPTRAEMAASDHGQAWMDQRQAELAAVLGGQVRWARVGADPRWRVDHYMDDIHPHAEGIRVLAGVVRDAL